MSTKSQKKARKKNERQFGFRLANGKDFRHRLISVPPTQKHAKYLKDEYDLNLDEAVEVPIAPIYPFGKCFENVKAYCATTKGCKPAYGFAIYTAACGCFVYVEHHAIVYNTDKQRYICVTENPENFKKLYFIRDDAFSEDIMNRIKTVTGRPSCVVDSETLVRIQNGSKIKSCKHLPLAVDVICVDAERFALLFKSSKCYLTLKEWKEWASILSLEGDMIIFC